jgi:hypothetical protein
MTPFGHPLFAIGTPRLVVCLLKKMVHKTPRATRSPVSEVYSVQEAPCVCLYYYIIHLSSTYFCDSWHLPCRPITQPHVPVDALVFIFDAVGMYSNIVTAHAFETMQKWFDLHSTHSTCCSRDLTSSWHTMFFPSTTFIGSRWIAPQWTHCVSAPTAPSILNTDHAYTDFGAPMNDLGQSGKLLEWASEAPKPSMCLRLRLHLS